MYVLNKMPCICKKCCKSSKPIHFTEVFTMETEENSWISLNPGTPYEIDLRIDQSFNLNDDLCEEGNKISPLKSVKSPTIPIPKALNKSLTEFSNIGCNVGSKTSNDEFTYGGFGQSTNISEEIYAAVVDEQNPITLQTDDTKSATIIQEHVQMDQIYQKSISNECTTSEMSAESIIWLSHRLGPVLTARYLSRNLLRMLTLCYTGKENLTVINDTCLSMEGIPWNTKVLVGDRNATKVLECLAAIAG